MFKKSILAKILGVVISITIIGFGGLIYIVLDHERNDLLIDMERTSGLTAEHVLIVIYKDMLEERADMARHFVENIKTIKGAERVQVIRSNGVEEAFQDFKTLNAVKKEYGELKPEWVKDHPDKKVNVAGGIDNIKFKEAVRLFNKGKKEGISYIEEYNGKRLFTYLAPIEAKTTCKRCHTAVEQVRGILMVSTSAEDMYAAISSNIARWITYGFFMIAGVSILVAFVVRNIIRPLKTMTSTAKEIAGGNYNVSIPVYTSDEVGFLSEAFNKMAVEIKARVMDLKMLSAAIEQSINIIFITDNKGNIQYVNPMFEKVTGYAKDEVIGQNPRILASGLTTKAQYADLWGTITAEKTWHGVFRNRKKNGQHYWVNVVIIPIKNEKGEIAQLLSVQEDITEKKKYEERVQYLAYYDELTGLVNRLRFIDIITGQLSYAKTPEQACMLLLINIDEFKYVNETYGHNIGDEFLKGVARLLENIFRDIDAKYIEKTERKSIVGRLGGDEFAVFMPYDDEKEAMDAALQIQEMMKELYDFISMPVHLTASIGIVFYPKHGTTTKELFTKVNAAMFHARETGRGKCHVYRLEDNDLEKVHTGFEWMGRIQRAIEEDRFLPWFQPILDLKHNKISHYEALARMRGEDGNILLPAAFIEAAERFGLIGAIDRIIIEKTMRLQAETWQQGRHLTFAMNLSGKDLGDEEIMTFLRSKIVETGAKPEYLVFEITETAAVRDINKAVKFIRDLKSIGCHFSLDDFGVGFTSFIYLREMDVDYVKIDGAFIKTLHKEYRDQLFVKAISDVARGMGIKTTAEFVENEEIIKFLKRLGVDYAQGYAIGKPAPWEKIERGHAPDS